MTLSVDSLALAPAAVPMIAALLVLLLDVVAPRRALLPWCVAGLGLAGALVPIGMMTVSGHEPATLCARASGCMWRSDHVGLGLQGLALLTALVTVFLAALERRRGSDTGRAAPRAMLLLSATAGCVGVVAARDLASWLVLIELATLPSVALVALRGGRAALHGALTLLVTALVSFAVLALGAATWFAATGSVMITGDTVLAAYSDPARKPLLVIAMMLILAGVGFKLSLAPFHAWTPEAFAGSGSWVAAFLATTAKVGALGGMLVVLRAATALGSSALVPLAIVAALSMTVGNVMALRQNNALRLMAWSTVAQAGWVVLPMTAVAVGSVTAASAYLALYALGTMAVFVVLAGLEDVGRREGHDVQGLPRGLAFEDVRGLFRTHPLLALTMTLGLLALAGLPPSIIGVVAKVLALRPAVSGGLWWLVVIAAINAVLGVAVYLRWIAGMFTSAQESTIESRNSDGGQGAVRFEALPPARRAYGVLAALLSLVVVVSSLAPQALLSLF